MNEHGALFKATLAARYEQLQQLLVEQLNPLLEALPPLLRKDVKQALRGEGKLLAPPLSFADADRASAPELPNGHWGLLSLLSALYVTPGIDQQYAASVGVAAECLACAIDLFDDLMDEDQTPTLHALGMPGTLNVAGVLLSLAMQAILSVEASHDTRPLLKTLLAQNNLVAFGQHQDVDAEKRQYSEYTSEMCLEIARNKAGGLMRLACQLGAQSAGASDPLYELIGKMSELFGISQQLDNDAHDLYHVISQPAGVPATKTDLSRGKKSLPLVLVFNGKTVLPETPFSSAEGEELEAWLSAFREGIHATWGVSLLFRERARDCLREIEARTQRPYEPALLRLLGFR